MAVATGNLTSQPSGFGSIASGVGDIVGGILGAGQSLVSMPGGLEGIAGGLLSREAYNRLSNIGDVARQEAMGIAERGQAESQFRPFTVTTPTGASFTARMGGQPMQPTGQMLGQQSFLPFLQDPTGGYGLLPMPASTGPDIGEPMPSQIFGPDKGGNRMGTQPVTGVLPDGMMYKGAPLRQAPIQSSDSLRNLFAGISPTVSFPQTAQPTQPAQPAGGLEIGMTLSPEEQALQRQLLGGAGGFFGQAAQPTTSREQAVFERMRAAQRPEEERQRLALEERLAAQGRLGTSSAAYGGATPEGLAMATAQQEARDRAMLGAMQQAQAEQAQQAALGQQFLGAGYLPQQQLVSALQPGLIQQELAQQAQQFGTGLFGETALSGIEAQLLAEQARANLLGGVGSNLITGMMNQQRAASAAPSGGGSSALGGLFSSIAGGLGNIGGGIADLLGIGG